MEEAEPLRKTGVASLQQPTIRHLNALLRGPSTRRICTNAGAQDRAKFESMPATELQKKCGMGPSCERTGSCGSKG